MQTLDAVHDTQSHVTTVDLQYIKNGGKKRKKIGHKILKYTLH